MRLDSSGHVKINNAQHLSVAGCGRNHNSNQFRHGMFAGGQNSTSGSGAKIYLMMLM